MMDTALLYAPTGTLTPEITGFSYIKDNVPLQNVSALYVVAHGSARGTVFGNIKKHLQQVMHNSDSIVDRLLIDIKNFIYQKVLFSPSSRTNTYSFMDVDLSDKIQYGFEQYNKNNGSLTSTKLK